jgi:hypothetical protein
VRLEIQEVFLVGIFFCSSAQQNTALFVAIFPRNFSGYRIGRLSSVRRTRQAYRNKVDKRSKAKEIYEEKAVITNC